MFGFCIVCWAHIMLVLMSGIEPELWKFICFIMAVSYANSSFRISLYETLLWNEKTSSQKTNGL